MVLDLTLCLSALGEIQLFKDIFRGRSTPDWVLDVHIAAFHLSSSGSWAFFYPLSNFRCSHFLSNCASQASERESVTSRYQIVLTVGTGKKLLQVDLQLQSCPWNGSANAERPQLTNLFIRSSTSSTSTRSGCESRALPPDLLVCHAEAERIPSSFCRKKSHNRCQPPVPRAGRG